MTGTAKAHHRRLGAYRADDYKLSPLTDCGEFGPDEGSIRLNEVGLGRIDRPNCQIWQVSQLASPIALRDRPCLHPAVWFSGLTCGP